MRWQAVAVLATAFLLISLGENESRAHAASAADVTFQDPAANLRTYHANIGGGSILLTFTSDLSGIVHARIDGAQFPPSSTAPTACAGTASGHDSFYPPAAVAVDGAFALRILFLPSNPEPSAVFINGTLSADGVISATAYYGSIQSGYPCESARLTASFSGPVDTPPGPNDLVYAGEISGGGTILFAMRPDGSVTFLRLTGLQLVDCHVQPFDAVALFDPPLTLPGVIDEDLPAEAMPIHVWQSLSDMIAIQLAVHVKPHGPAVGDLIFRRIPGPCRETLRWSAAPVSSESPTATPQPARPPATGMHPGSSSGMPILPLLCLAAGALAVGGGAVLGGRRPRVR